MSGLCQNSSQKKLFPGREIRGTQICHLCGLSNNEEWKRGIWKDRLGKNGEDSWMSIFWHLDMILKKRWTFKGFYKKARGFPGGPTVKNPPTNAGDSGDKGSIPGSERCPEGGNGNPLQCSCLENSMGRGAWWAATHGVAKSWMQRSNRACRQSRSNQVCMLEGPV